MRKFTPFSDPDDVLAAVKPVTDVIHSGLADFLPLTRQYFDSKARPVDKALHAMMTRFELRWLLTRQQIPAENEEEVDGRYLVHNLANCGLVVHVANCTLRVLKSKDFELPPSNSHQRADFYQQNLFFEATDPNPDIDVPPLNLVAAWNTDLNHELGSFSIVCPWGENDGKVNNKWWRTLSLGGSAIPRVQLLPPEPSLDEITPKNSLPGVQTQIDSQHRNEEPDNTIKPI